MKKINEGWHNRNVMPKNATLDQRIKWHQEHGKNCDCRPIPARIAAEITKRKLG